MALVCQSSSEAIVMLSPVSCLIHAYAVRAFLAGGSSVQLGSQFVGQGKHLQKSQLKDNINPIHLLFHLLKVSILHYLHTYIWMRKSNPTTGNFVLYRKWEPCFICTYTFYHLTGIYHNGS